MLFCIWNSAMLIFFFLKDVVEQLAADIVLLLGVHWAEMVLLGVLVFKLALKLKVVWILLVLEKIWILHHDFLE